MRVLRAIVFVILTIILVWVLDKTLGSLPAIGRLLDPVQGCLANAEPVNYDFSQNIKCASLQHPVTVWLDSRMVPHIHATNDYDVYYIEGYIHAIFRLWQMDMETRAAAGRVSEVIGSKGFNYDRLQRRKGMVYAAENSLKAIEADPRAKLMLDAYSAGINSYIATLRYRTLPLEYKLMGFTPEPWTNLKSALLLKYMADDLTGYTEDIPLTYLRDMLPAATFKALYPEKIQDSKPVIPMGTVFAPPSLTALPQPNDSVWSHFKASDFAQPRDEGKGSNNWVLSGSRTQSGAAILCNDPHLGINLPSLWFEVQLQAPGMNVYGVSLPGAPGVVIGFNDSITWGFTNNYRDVKDFYEVHRVTGGKDKYWFAGKQLGFDNRVERIKIKDKPDYVDTVRYTIQGPVLYDENYHGPGGLQKPLAMCWMAHRATSELLSIYLLNRATNYTEFVDAIMHFECPAQNMAYADRAGNIALWGQGQFVNKWKEQGRYIMNGADSAGLWKELIPMRENPHALNPGQGYLASANQSVTDSTYPYYYNGTFYEFRAWRINQVLDTMHKATVQDMFALQNDTYSILAANMLPVMLANISFVNDKYTQKLKNWNCRLEAESKAATIFQVWWNYLYAGLWEEHFKNVPDNLWPLPERTMQLIQSREINSYCGKGNGIGTFEEVVQLSYQKTTDSLKKLEATTGLEWYKVKNTSIKHLTKLPAFSVPGLKIGGWGNVVNAAKSDHAPSWRMVVQMGKEIEAYAVYPGGQSGNPGSQYYADFVNNWVSGKYYRLQFFANTAQQAADKAKFTINFNPQ
ncbi:MAG: penicillin acylase family protein [Flavipsychrobacter sp.]|nr:penicillin acylase family protein [Flavipsychrobacter sp.]